MYFDRACNRRGNGAEFLLVDPEGVQILFVVKLDFPTTNNIAEYEAFIYGVEAALVVGARYLTMYGDSNLIISQIIGISGVRDERLHLYKEYLQEPIPYFDEINFNYLPREQNTFTDALANLAINLTWENDTKIQSILIEEKKVDCDGGINCFYTNSTR